jgi:hypothetical protein
MKTLLLALALIGQESLEKRLDEIVPRLAAEEIRERDAAVRELYKLVDAAGRKAREPVRARMKSATDASVRASLLSALRRLPALELKIDLDGEAIVGKPVAFKIRIKNIGDEEAAVVRSLDASDVRWRYPHFTAQIRGPEGKPVPMGGIGRCGYMNQLRAEDFAVLKPDEEFNPLGTGAFGIHQLSSWTPAAAGKHVVELSIDYSAEDPALWNGRMERHAGIDETVRQLLARVPKVKLEAKVEFEVKR